VYLAGANRNAPVKATRAAVSATMMRACLLGARCMAFLLDVARPVAEHHQRDGPDPEEPVHVRDVSASNVEIAK
jgi:hypothetical protein